MYRNSRVKIPQIPGKIVTRKKNKTTYVYFEIERIYNSEKGYTVPKRVVIGKVCEDDESMMCPNEHYFDYYPDAVIPAEDLTKRSCCLRLGAYTLVKSVIDEYKLDAVLRPYFEDRTGLLLDLASYLIVSEDNAAQYYPDYAFNHPLFTPKMRVLSDGTVSRFLSSVTKDQIIGALNSWNNIQDHRQRIYVAYDSTNKNCQAGDIDIVEFGHPKDDKGQPIVNVSVAYDSNNKVPLLYETYSGSINDVSQFKYLVDKIIEYKYRRLGFILDRGYFSRSNFQYMDEKGYEFLIMVKGCKKLVNELVLQHRGQFESDIDCFVETYNVYGTSCKQKLFPGDKKERYFHIYFSESKFASERLEHHNKIKRLKNELKEMEGSKIQIAEPFTHYFDCHYDGDTFLFATPKKDVIARELDLCGYFCIVSSEKMTSTEAYLLYKSRDTSEKLFRADKSYLGSHSMRVQTEETLSAEIFIEFIALIIRNRIYNLLKEQMLRLKTRKNTLTVPAAIREMEKIELVRRNNGLYRLDHAITKNQIEILSSFGLTESDVKELAKRVADELKQDVSDDLEDEQESNNAEDEDCQID